MKSITIGSIGLICLIQSLTTLAQKRVLDTADLIGSKRFEYVNEPLLSPDGKYTAYLLKNRPVGRQTLIVHDNTNNRELTLSDANAIVFYQNSASLLVQSADTVLKIDLQTFKPVKKNTIAGYIKPSSRNYRWILLREQNEKFRLVDLKTGKENELSKCTSAEFDPSGSCLLTRTEENGRLVQLDLIELEKWKSDEVYKRKNISDSTKLIRSIYGKDGKICLVLQDHMTHYLYWEPSGKQCIELINDQNPFVGIERRLSIDVTFSADGEYLVFRMFQAKQMRDERKADVNVWSYKDIQIQSFQLNALSKSDGVANYSAAINLHTRKMIQLNRDFEGTEILPAGHLAVVRTNEYLGGARIPTYLRPKYDPKVFVVSMEDGVRHLIGDFKTVGDQTIVSSSPNSHYIVYYNPSKKCFDSYDVATGRIINLTESHQINLVSETANVTEKMAVSGVVSWQQDSDNFLIYDNFDIWMLDASGKEKPNCLTKNAGKNQQIKFRLANANKYFNYGEELLLTGFSVVNKKNGFAIAHASRNGAFQIKTLFACTFYHENSQLAGNAHEFVSPQEPLKAASANIWLVSKQTAESSPNYFITRDFENFQIVSNIFPEKETNWLTSELITWQPPKGPSLQGVLYKPENFDPNKKYPVIINYYEQLSHRLYEFPKPELASENLNIPYMVSNGYLVFTPDIHFENGNISNVTSGEWALNAVESGAKFLAKLPYVDPAKIGIQGHSFGGMETAFIVTHSNLFAAAMEAAGATEPISHYLSIMNAFGGTQEYLGDPNGIELGHYLYGASLWERPDLFLRNSAILNADKITTPLLIMHNRADNSLNWHQGVALYFSLQRLQKRCWMLEYDHESHTLLEDKNALDYTIRMKQFFDHYLKGMPAPIWMTKGIPAKLKGIEDGYALDPGVEP